MLRNVGYQDSGADIAYTLQRKGISVLTPSITPDPHQQEGWCFPDNEAGILAAVQQGATHLWANTILFASHPLQTSSAFAAYESQVHVVGQPPSIVENLDDKAYLNGRLNQLGSFTLPRSWLVQKSDSDLDAVLNALELPSDAFPIVGKPVRGRGSHGVQVCQDYAQLRAHLASLLNESPLVMLEEYLAGKEATLTVMPPSSECPRYWCLPPVCRFNHVDGIAPYNGTVAVTANSHVVELQDQNIDPEHEQYRAIMRECERVAEVIQTTAPIRIDIRQFREGGPFALFDINMKPVCFVPLVHHRIKEMANDAEYDGTWSTWTRRPGELDSDGSGCYRVGLRDVAGEDPRVVEAVGRMERMSVSGLVAG